jgi:DNA-binding MarR family transcriptional regulator
MTDPLSTYPGYALRRAATAMWTELTGRLADLVVRPVDATVLILMDEEPGLTASAIGRILDIQRANMVPLLKRLEAAGLIEKKPIDGKSLGLLLSPAGREQLIAVRRVIEEFEADLLSRVPAEHRPHLIPALNALWR